MIMNDFSARALQMQEMKLNLGPAKGKDFGSSFGPWLVTKDELEPYRKTSTDGDRYDLQMKACVNDIQVSEDTLSNMTWTFAQIIERVSYGVDIFPGDIIGSGTCGTGCFLELNGSKITNNQWLYPGDTITLEIEGLGILTNKIILND
jgi:fumarylacetoacetate (FAA) hydrolase